MLHLYGLFLSSALDGDCASADVELAVLVGVGSLLGGDSGPSPCWIACFTL